IGRLPVVATLAELDVETMKTIFTEPKNSIYKQYQRIFEMEDVKLKFTEEAIDAIAKKAIEREAGARGLRSIVEHIMMDLMFEIPSREDVEQVIITPGVIEKQEGPVLIYRKENGKENGREAGKESDRKKAASRETEDSKESA
ncbi:MAG: ATP-dependent Clp protease ATP-binding subunit ClpX, partial [Spirochaetae bacterium HGW-Spirochaetae-10]